MKNTVILIIVIVVIFAVVKILIITKKNRDKEAFIKKCQDNIERTFINVDCEAEWNKSQAK